jgi:predicted ATPase
MEASAACADAIYEALGDVGVHAAPIEAKEPAADVNRASDTLTSRYDDPVL